jgi:hypothetical protein
MKNHPGEDEYNNNEDDKKNRGGIKSEVHAMNYILASVLFNICFLCVCKFLNNSLKSTIPVANFFRESRNCGRS